MSTETFTKKKKKTFCTQYRLIPNKEPRSFTTNLNDLGNIFILKQ